MKTRKILAMILALAMLCMNNGFMLSALANEGGEPAAEESVAAPEAPAPEPEAPAPEPEAPAPEPEAPAPEPEVEEEPEEEPEAEPEEEPAADYSAVEITYTAVDENGSVIGGIQDRALEKGEYDLSARGPEALDGYRYAATLLNGAKLTRLAWSEAEAAWTYALETGEAGLLTENAALRACYEAIPAEPEIPTRTEYTYTDRYIKAVITLTRADAVPDDAVLRVTPVTDRSRDYNYDAYMEALNDRGAQEEYTAENTLLYDFAFMVDEKDADGKPTGSKVEFQPEAGTMTVKVTFRKNQISDGLGAENAEDVSVVHLPLKARVLADDDVNSTAEATDIRADDVRVEQISDNRTDVSLEGRTDSVEFTTSSFSVFAFTVEFHYEGVDYSIPGRSQILLSDLIKKLNIQNDGKLLNVADVREVYFTDAHLVEVQQVSGLIVYNEEADVDVGDKDFLLTSKEPFSTRETLTIWLTDGTPIIVGVTDAQYWVYLDDGEDEFSLKTLFQEKANLGLDTLNAIIGNDHCIGYFIDSSDDYSSDYSYSIYSDDILVQCLDAIPASDYVSLCFYSWNDDWTDGEWVNDKGGSFIRICFKAPTCITCDDGVLVYEVKGGRAVVTGLKSGAPSAITVPEKITAEGAEYPVTAIRDSAFKGKSGLTVTVEGSIEVRGGFVNDGDYSGAFSNCDGLTVEFRGKDVALGASAFQGCSNLTVKSTYAGEGGSFSLGRKAFAFVDGLDLTVGSGHAVSGTAYNVFQSTSGELAFLGGVSGIGGYSFYNSGISKITTTLKDTYGWNDYGLDYPIDIVFKADAGGVNWSKWSITKSLTIDYDAAIDSASAVLGGSANTGSPVTVNFNGGVGSISAGVFARLAGGGTLEINVADNGGTTAVADGAIPDEDGVAVHFDMYRENVTGADALDALEHAVVTYREKPVDCREEGKTQILLSALASSIGIWNPDTEAALAMADVASVSFPEADATDVREVSGRIVYNRTAEENLAVGDDVGEKDFLLSRDGKFTVMTRMTVTTVEGTVIEVNRPYTAHANPFSLKDALAEAGIHFTGSSTLAFASSPVGYMAANQDEAYYVDGQGYTDADVTIKKALPDGRAVLKVYGRFWDGASVKYVTILQGEEIEFDEAPVDDGGTFTLAIDADAQTVTITGLAKAYAGDGSITIPAALEHDGTQYAVTAIDDGAFDGEQRLSTVIFGNGESAVHVGDFAFNGCDNLTAVSGDGLITFRQEPFAGNAALETLSVKIADGSGAILASGNPALTAVTVDGAAIDALPSNYLYENAALETVSFPGGVKAFSESCFTGCAALTAVNLGEDGANGGYEIAVAEDAFRDNASLASGVKVRQTVTSADGTVALEATADGLPLGARLVINSREEDADIKAAAESHFEGVPQTFVMDYYDLSLVAPNGESFQAAADVTIPMDAEWVATEFVPKPNAVAFHKTTEVEQIDGVTMAQAGGRLTSASFHTNGFSPFGVGYEKDGRYHDDMFWYDLADDNGATKAVITGVYAGYEGTTLEFGGTTRDDNIYPVTGVAAGAFKGNTAITAITGDNKLDGFVIGEGACEGMTALKSVVLGVTESGMAENCSGRVTVESNAFKGCTALAGFTDNYNNATIAANAFNGCSGLKKAAFTGKGNMNIAKDAFKGARGIEYLRLDNPFDVAEGAFSASNGTAFVQNNDSPLSNLPAKIGKFNTYVFAGNPWWMSSEGLKGSNAPKTIYIANENKNLSHDFVNAVTGAGSRLTDVYIDCAREDVAFADELDSANANVKIHYNENQRTCGFCLDGVAGDDETADGSEELPYRTFAALAADWAGLNVDDEEPVVVEDTVIGPAVEAAYDAVGVDRQPGEFRTQITREKIAVIRNTVTVSENETWQSPEGETIEIYRDPDFKGVMVDVTGALTLRDVVLDGNKGVVTASGSIVRANSGATLNIGDGAVLRNNSYPSSAWDGYIWRNGGGVFADHATVNVQPGSLIDGNLAMYGGGIHMTGGTLNMTGGTISNNVAAATVYTNNLKVNGNGGGVLLSQGATMNLSGGSVTGNEARGVTAHGIGVSGSTGGGIQVGAFYADPDGGSVLNMTGGTVSNNKARAEGGGIIIQANCDATVTKGDITGNESGGGEFGGGGFYVNAVRSGGRNGRLRLYNVLITDNTAQGYGGGIACCETVNLNIYMGSGSAIYGNNDDDLYLFLRQTYKGTKAVISSKMMNGADYNWTYADGTEVPEDLLGFFDAGRWDNSPLISHPSNTSVSPSVRITGNKAGTRGGGIGSNGDVIIGDVPPSGKATWTPDLDKTLIGRDMKDGERFTFTVYEEHPNFGANYYSNVTYDPDTVAGTGYVVGGKDGKPKQIVFTPVDLGTKSVSDVGEVAGRFIVIEDPVSDEDIESDTGNYYYFIVVTGVQVVNGEDKLVGVSEIIQKGKYSRDEDGNIQYEMNSYNSRERDDIRAYYEEKVIQRAEKGFENLYLKREISADKSWLNFDGSDTPPEGVTVTFELYADGEPTGKTVRLDGTADEGLTAESKADGEYEPWVATFRDEFTYRMGEDGKAVRDADGNPIKIAYTVKEVFCTAGYTAENDTVDPDGTILNKQDTVTIEATKKWADGNKTELREDVVLHLNSRVGGAAVRPMGAEYDRTIPAGATGSALKVTWENLPAYRGGKRITYTVTEDPILEYRTEITGSMAAGYTVTNTYVPEKVEISATKVWRDDDNRDGKRANVVLHLNKRVGSGAVQPMGAGYDRTIPASATGAALTVTWKNLPKYENKKAVAYSVTEERVPGYGEPQISGDAESGFVILNPYTPETTEATVVKVWNDDDDRDSLRPTELKVALNADGVKVDEVTLNEGNGWTATVKDLPKFDKGVEIQYTWSEPDVEGYTSTSGAQGTVTTLTNAHKPEPTPTVTPEPTPTATPEPTSISGTKIWVDEGNAHNTRPDGITLKLFADGQEISAVPVWTDTDTDTWHFTYNNLPSVNADGGKIEYTVQEVPVENYRSTVSGTQITNRLIPKETEKTTEVSGAKTWKDNRNAAGKRPGHIVVRLLRNGVEVGQRTVTAANGWKYSFTDLPADDGYGNVYEYTVREDPVEGYFTRVNGYSITNTVLPDTPGKPGKPGKPDQPGKPPRTSKSRKTGTPPPQFEKRTAEELDELTDLFDYDTPLWGGLLGTGDETPVYPYVFGGAGAAAVIALLAFGRKKKKKDGSK